MLLNLTAPECTPEQWISPDESEAYVFITTNNTLALALALAPTNSADRQIDVAINVQKICLKPYGLASIRG